MDGCSSNVDCTLVREAAVTSSIACNDPRGMHGEGFARLPDSDQGLSSGGSAVIISGDERDAGR